MWLSVVDDVGGVAGDTWLGWGFPGLRDPPYAGIVLSTLSWATLHMRRSALVVVGFPMPALCCPRRQWDFLRWQGSTHVVLWLDTWR